MQTCSFSFGGLPKCESLQDIFSLLPAFLVLLAILFLLGIFVRQWNSRIFVFLLCRRIMFPPRVSIFFCFLDATKHICRAKRSSSTKNNSFEFSSSVSSCFSPLSKTTQRRNIAYLWPRMFQDFPARSRTFLFVRWKEPLGPCFAFFLFPQTALFPVVMGATLGSTNQKAGFRSRGTNGPISVQNETM